MTADKEESAATYLVTAKEIEAMEGLSKAHFLNPNARRVNKSLGDLTGLTGFGFHLIEVEPGCETTEHHVHFHEDECVYVLDGEATALIGDIEPPIGSGDFIGYRKGGLAHSIRNTGDRTLRCIVVGERLPHDVGDYPNKAKRIYRNAGLPWSVVDHDAILTPKGAGKK
ncbi:MAG: cupin domain-containing protein [Tropicimonas sp.]|uniref:cupin domain-containing protein n=1 Tax=Tropicimonas sp. TaxID=2067044 RepID=UPI003A89468A